MESISSALLESFVELVVERSFKDVTALAVCERAHASRAAFYSRFQGKQGLLRAVLEEDICAPIRNIRSSIYTEKYWDLAHSLIDEAQCKNILARATFYRKVVAECPHLFADELTAGLAAVNASVLEPYAIEAMEKEYMAYFYAASHAMLYRKWIEDGMDVDADLLCDWHFKWAVESWQRISAENGIGMRQRDR